MLPVERADERASLEDDRRVSKARPVVLAARDRAVEELGRVDGAGQRRRLGRHAVDELVVERPEVRELNQGGHRRQAFVGAELEALDLGRLGVERRAGQLLGDLSVVRRAHASSSSLPSPPGA